MEGFKSDIFSCAGNELFMRNQAFKPDLEPIEPEEREDPAPDGFAGFLNDSPQHRTYWTVDRDLRYGGATGTFGSGPAGDTIAFDGKLFYEIRGYAPGRNLAGRGRGIDPLEIYSVYSGSYVGRGGGRERVRHPGDRACGRSVGKRPRPLPGTRLSPPKTP